MFLFYSAIGFTDLSPDLQKEVTDLQQRMVVELEPLVLESTLTMQKILETNEHKGRVNLVRFFVEAERKRLEARKMLQNVFGIEKTASEMVPLSEVLAIDDDDESDDCDADNEDDEDVDSQESSSIFDDENAFQ